ncbi:MAG: hypothetical protein ABR589_07425, partial [Chthoniobacterales bacterium]
GLAFFFGAGLLIWLYQEHRALSLAWWMAAPVVGAVLLILAFWMLPRLLTVAAALLRRPPPHFPLPAVRERGARFLERLRIELAAPA